MPTKRAETTFVWPDTHAPYHDPVAVAVAAAACRALKPRRLVIIGDFFDFYAVSFYAKNPRRKALLDDEIEAAREVVDTIVSLDVPEVHWLDGNHEYRLARYVAEKAPALTGLVRGVRDLLPKHWHYKPYGEMLRCGKMLYCHDFGRAGVNASRQGLVDVGANIAYGHTHQLNMCTIGQQRGDAHVALNCGWLGGLEHIDYKHAALAKRTYQHGFGVVRQDKRGNVWPVPVAILGRSCIVDGQIVRV